LDEVARLSYFSINCIYFKGRTNDDHVQFFHSFDSPLNGTLGNTSVSGGGLIFFIVISAIFLEFIQNIVDNDLSFLARSGRCDPAGAIATRRLTEINLTYSKIATKFKKIT
jgi:hypothetical protein